MCNVLSGGRGAAALLAVLALTVVPCQGAAAGVTAFTTEAALRGDAAPAAIERFWDDRGQGGHFSGQGGLKLAFRRFVQPDVSVEKGAIVIVSGRTESMVKYKELVHDLWHQGWSVYLHDHRGQGLSEREPAVAATPQKGHVGRFGDYVEDLRRFLATEVAAGGHRHQFLLAHSMGGAITALLLEAGGPEVDRLQGAVLSSPMLRIKGMAGQPADLVSCRIARQRVDSGHATDYVVGGRGYRAKAFERNDYTSSRVRYERFVAAYQVEQVQLGSPTYGWLDAACEAAFQARRQAARVRTPVRVVVAGDDGIVHNSGAREFCRGVSPSPPPGGCDGPGGAPIVVPAARHELFIERDELRQPALQAALDFFEARRR